MRRAPVRINRVAVKAATGMVVDATCGDGPERVARGRQHPVISRPPPPVEKEQEIGFLRKLHRLAEAPVCAVMRVQQAGSGLPKHGFIDRCRRCALGGDPGHRVGDALGLLCELGPAGAVPDFGDRGEKLEKGCLRIIGPGMEGSPVGQKEEGVRPAALAGQQLGGQHVGVVEIRTCLAVDLDGNEVRIQCPGHFLIIETLLFHDMTPVTGGISDREEDGPVLAPRSCKSLFTPGMPA